MPKTKNAPTSDNKSKPEVVKPTKTLTPKKQIEFDHLTGKHKAENETHELALRQAHDNPDCGFCQRRAARYLKKIDATKRYMLANKK